MVLFDKFKKNDKKTKEQEEIKVPGWDDDLGKFVYEYNGLAFVWDEDIQDVVKMLADNYFSHLDAIIDFMMPDIVEMYGDVSAEDVKNHLGKPIIDYNNGQVTYVEQSFDDIHIFTFEFLDDAFEDLQYFSIDG